MIDAKRLKDAIREYAQPEHYAAGNVPGGCVSYTIDDPKTFLESVAQIVGACSDVNDRSAVAHAFGRARWDSMGRGMVVYFPLVAWDGAIAARGAEAGR